MHHGSGGVSLRHLHRGSWFGDSVLDDSPREATAVTRGNCKLLRVERRDFRSLWQVKYKASRGEAFKCKCKTIYIWRRRRLDEKTLKAWIYPRESIISHIKADESFFLSLSPSTSLLWALWCVWKETSGVDDPRRKEAQESGTATWERRATTHSLRVRKKFSFLFRGNWFFFFYFLFLLFHTLQI